MNEHMKIGHHYPQVRQLLAYSFGLDDQDFLVAYETDDLPAFGDLVRELRGTESRRSTVSRHADPRGHPSADRPDPRAARARAQGLAAELATILPATPSERHGAGDARTSRRRAGGQGFRECPSP